MTSKSILIMILSLSFQSALADTNEKPFGSNLNPWSFGEDQVIIDLKKVVWQPLKVKGLPPGSQISVLRGRLDKGSSESLLRLPAGYQMPSHNHSSDELYVWIEGAFTLIAHNGKKIKFDGPAFISFPENAPPHGLECGVKKSCILYLRLSQPFDIKYFPDTTHH